MNTNNALSVVAVPKTMECLSWCLPIHGWPAVFVAGLLLWVPIGWSQPPPGCENRLIDSKTALYDGFINVALGNSTLSLESNNQYLAIHDIGSSGQDGAYQDVPRTVEMVTRLACPNLGASGPGARMVGEQIGHVDNVPGQLFSRLSVENTGTELRATGDWSFIGTTLYTIEIYTDVGGTLVTREAGLDRGVVIGPIHDWEAVDCKVGPPCELTYRYTPDIDPTLVISNRGAFQGRYVKIIAQNDTRRPNDQTRIVMTGRNLGTLVLTSEATVPAPSCPIPTLSQWGLVVFTLLLLTAGTLLILRYEPVALTAGAGGAVSISSNERQPLFVPSLFAKVLSGALASALVGLVGASWYFGSLATRDIIGTLISAVICAYWVHLLIGCRRN